MVIVANSCENKKALVGEILTIIAKNKKLAGIIIDGACRDIDGIKRLEFPCYAKSYYPCVSRSSNYNSFLAPYFSENHLDVDQL